MTISTSGPGREPDPPAAGGAEDDGRLYSIGDLATEFAITTRAIRFYESRGLLAPQRSGANRCYTRRDRGRLMLVLRGKNLGFSIEEIADYLSLYDRDPQQTAQTQLLIEMVDGHIVALTSKRADIERTLKELKAIRKQCLEHLSSRPRPKVTKSGGG